MSTPAPEFRRELFTAVKGSRRDVRGGSIRVPAGATRVVCDGEEESDGEARKAEAVKHLALDVAKHRLRIPLFTDPRVTVRWCKG